MKNKIEFIIRYVLTMLLLWGAYTETGIFTTIALFLNAITIELLVRVYKRGREKL